MAYFLYFCGMYQDADLINEEQDLYEHFSIIVDPGQTAERIDSFLTRRIQNATRTKIQKAALAESILVNNKPVRSSYKVKPNDHISIVLPEPPRDTEIKPEPMDLNIVYEDQEVLVLNKPAGLVVHPGFNNYTGTLVHGLSYHFQNLPNQNGIDRPGLVHRIDKDTSGLMVIAKNEFALSFLAKQFFDHSIDRKYMAIVWGDVKEEEGTISTNLVRDPKDRRRSVVTQDESEGKHAITHYKVLKRFYFATLVECTLETGRTHQIRAHLRYLGHPLFSDELYGGNVILKGSSLPKFKYFIENCLQQMPRQALHAYSLGFDHPVSKKRLYFEQLPPNDFSQTVEKFSAYSSQIQNH
jgi:23S rRNA pseudouridine1911/1915/1917 synthase